MIASGMVALAIGDTKTMRGLFCWTIQQIGKGVRGTCGPGKPLKTPLSVQYRLIYDRGELTMSTFRDVYRNLAVTPLSLGALRRKGKKKKTSQRELGKGSAVSDFWSIYARIGRSGTMSQCGRMCNFVTRRRRCSGSRKKLRSHLGRLELPNGTPCVAYRKGKGSA